MVRLYLQLKKYACCRYIMWKKHIFLQHWIRMNWAHVKAREVCCLCTLWVMAGYFLEDYSVGFIVADMTTHCASGHLLGSARRGCSTHWSWKLLNYFGWFSCWNVECHALSYEAFFSLCGPCGAWHIDAHTQLVTVFVHDWKYCSFMSNIQCQTQQAFLYCIYTQHSNQITFKSEIWGEKLPNDLFPKYLISRVRGLKAF